MRKRLLRFLPWAQRPRVSQQPYCVYTTRFDREIEAREIDKVLGSLSTRGRIALARAWDELQTGLLPWRTQLLLICAEMSAQIRTWLTEQERSDTAVTLLIDQSGSMRGQKMLFAAASADIAQEFLRTLGITCEVLGFTTTRWRGGRSRSLWNWHLRPAHPGRLNDLLHIIYKDADDCRSSLGDHAFRQMLRPDLPKENIDGEALLWAAKRLHLLPQRRKYLVLISDGAPVDDSTLHENGPDYLSHHLTHVVEQLTAERILQLATIGIGHRSKEHFSATTHVEAPDDLGRSLIELLARILANDAG